MGTQNLKKVPMGTQVPKWGQTWEQWDTCATQVPAQTLRVNDNDIPVASRVVYLPRTSPPPDGVSCLVDWVPDKVVIWKALDAQFHLWKVSGSSCFRKILGLESSALHPCSKALNIPGNSICPPRLIISKIFSPHHVALPLQQANARLVEVGQSPRWERHIVTTPSGIKMPLVNECTQTKHSILTQYQRKYFDTIILLVFRGTRKCCQTCHEGRHLLALRCLPEAKLDTPLLVSSLEKLMMALVGYRR